MDHSHSNNSTPIAKQVEFSQFLATYPQNAYGCCPSPTPRTPLSGIPSTPSPFKRAFAALERSEGPIRNQDYPVTPGEIADIHDMIVKEIKLENSNCATPPAFLLDTGVKISHQKENQLDYNIIPQTPPRDANYPSFPIGNKILDTPNIDVIDSPLATPGAKNLALHHQQDQDYMEWLKIACGKTALNEELTAKARAILQRPY